jgi:hypothetical protein
MAAGELARRQVTLDLQPDVPRTIKSRQVVLYVHLSESAITGAGGALDLARVENNRQGLTAEQVRTWCANPDTQITVKPVIVLAEHIQVDAYEIPDRLREQAVLRDGWRVLGSDATPAMRSCDEEVHQARSAA